MCLVMVHAVGGCRSCPRADRWIPARAPVTGRRRGPAFVLIAVRRPKLATATSERPNSCHLPPPLSTTPHKRPFLKRGFAAVRGWFIRVSSVAANHRGHGTRHNALLARAFPSTVNPRGSLPWRLRPMVVPGVVRHGWNTEPRRDGHNHRASVLMSISHGRVPAATPFRVFRVFRGSLSPDRAVPGLDELGSFQGTDCISPGERGSSQCMRGMNCANPVGSRLLPAFRHWQGDVVICDNVRYNVMKAWLFRFWVRAAVVRVPPSGGFAFPAEAGTLTGCRSQLETEESKA